MKPRAPQGIHPNAVYPIASFREISGISETRIRLARREGIDLPTMAVGRRKFVSGEDAIAFMQKLATAPNNGGQS